MVQRPWTLTGNTDLAHDNNSFSFRGKLPYTVEHLRWTGTYTLSTVTCLNLDTGMWQGWDVIKECWLLSIPAWLLNWHLPSLDAMLSQVLSFRASNIYNLSTHCVDPALRDRLSLSQVTRDWCINRGAGIILQRELWASLWVKYLGQYYEHIISRHLSLECKIKIGDFLVNQSKEKELFDFEN